MQTIVKGMRATCNGYEPYVKHLTLTGYRESVQDKIREGDTVSLGYLVAYLHRRFYMHNVTDTVRRWAATVSSKR